MFYWLVVSLLWVFFKTFFALEVKGAENIPSKGAVLITGNHLSYLDPPLVGAAVRRRLNFMARESLFRFRPFAWLIKHLGTFPVKRGRPDRRALKKALDILQKGGGLVLFPEGTRSLNGTLQKGEPGAGMLALKSRAKIIPALISGSDKALPRGAKMLRLRKIRILFGKPVSLEEFYNQEEDKETYLKVTEKIMQSIGELSGENNSCREGRLLLRS
jgi:1-acyl-sn-glycerol-3-phosphate acyltransferase